MCVSKSLENKTCQARIEVRFVKTYETWFSLSHNCFGWLILTRMLLFMLIGNQHFFTCEIYFNGDWCVQQPVIPTISIASKIYCCSLELWLACTVCSFSFMSFILFHQMTISGLWIIFAYEYVHVWNKFLTNDILEIHLMFLVLYS